MLDQDMVEELR
jgi:hypothetical protein